MELFDLNRFVKAQDAYDSYSTALQEVKNGCKESHWMWYIFPQMRGLGHTSTSQKYGITSLLEAKAYLEQMTKRNIGKISLPWYRTKMRVGASLSRIL